MLCDECDGEGVMYDCPDDCPGEDCEHMLPCDLCDGTGEVADDTE